MMMRQFEGHLSHHPWCGIWRRGRRPPLLSPAFLQAIRLRLEENIVGLQVAVDDVLGVDVGAAAGDLGEQRENQRQTWCMGGSVKVTICEDGGQQRTAITVLLSSA